MLRQALIGFGLRFEEEGRESLFVDRFVLIHTRISQLFLVATGLLFALFFLWDRAVDPVHWTRVLALRELVLAPAIFATAGLLNIEALRSRLELVISITLCVTLAGFELICAQLDQGFRYGAAGMLLIYFGGVMIFPMRIGYLAAPSLVAIAGFLGLGVLVGHTPQDMTIANAISVTTAVVIAALGTIGRELAARREFLTGLALEDARGRVDDLLHSMLPRAIVNRMRAGETTIADQHGEVSIVFADLVGFTALSRTLSPEALVNMLNTVFSRFDAAAGRLGIEKIKTIGDAYMAVAGLSFAEGGRDHAERMADFALAMRDIAADLASEMRLPVTVRVGLHIGPVVAGVIGLRKPAFDCWGDAVNMASRLEHASGPGAVMISQSAYERLKDRFRVEEAASVDLKGIGVSRTYVLLGKRTAPSAQRAAG